MSKIAFFGLGNMGASMAKNLVTAKHDVSVFDLVPSQVEHLVAHGAKGASSVIEAATQADIVISMLPAGEHVHRLYFDSTQGQPALVDIVDKNTLFIDCSTIESNDAKQIAEKLSTHHHRFIDAPVSGGVAGAAAGTLTFIVGGKKGDFDQAQPVLTSMGKHIFHAGDVGAGQVAKICNNMLLAVLMAGTSEALNLAVNNGLDASVISNIMLQSSGRNWTLELYNPCPGVMPLVPSSNRYQGGFMVDLMNKDLGLAMQTATQSGSSTPMGSLAQSLFERHSKAGNGKKDFSSIYTSYSKP